MLSTSTLLGVAGVGSLAAAVAVRGAYQKRMKENKSISASAYHDQQKDLIQPILGSAEVFRSTKLSLYQYETCPYCAKLKAYLDYNSISYDEIEVSPMTKKEISHSLFKKVPQLQLGNNGPFLVDSSTIIDLLHPIFHPQHPERTDSDKEWQKRHSKLLGLLVINTNRNISEARERFAYAKNTNFSFKEKFMISQFMPLAMYGVKRMFIKPRLIKEGIYDPKMDERTALYQEINYWIYEGLNGNQLQGGESPSIADIETFGILRSMAPFPIFKDIQENVKQPEFSSWYSKMEELTNHSLKNKQNKE